jgi:MFS family permease
MGTAGLSALVFGRWFDHWGERALAIATVLAALFAPLTFLGNLAAAAVGVALWGIGMGIQDSLMNAPLAEIIHPDQRARAFGLFSALYGIAWFAGGTLLGILYDRSLTVVVAFSVITQAAAAALLATTRRPRQTEVA